MLLKGITSCATPQCCCQLGLSIHHQAALSLYMTLYSTVCTPSPPFPPLTPPLPSLPPLPHSPHLHLDCQHLLTAPADCTSVLQLRVNYPSAILSVASESDCTAGADWPATSLTFVCNARGNATSVLMNSILQPAFTSQQGGNISVASITFTAIAAGTGSLSVDILGMGQQGGGSVSGVSAVAAAGTVSILCKPKHLPSG